MTTVPARSLSGDHLGRYVDMGTAAHGRLAAIEHVGEHVVRLSLDDGRWYRTRLLTPDTPVTIEDTE